MNIPYTKQITSFFSVLCFLLLTVGTVNGQISKADWKMNALNSTAQARDANSYAAQPLDAPRVTISVQNFKQKLQKERQEIVLPTPDGQFETFIIEPTQVVGRAVSHLYTIKTFRGYKKGDPSVLLACDISEHGFNAGVYAANNTYFIEPSSSTIKETASHTIYYKHQSRAKGVNCRHKSDGIKKQADAAVKRNATPNQKTTYRLAIVATGEYGKNFGGTPYSSTNVLNALASGVNMIIPIYLRDLGITFTLVSTAAMVFEDPATDPINIASDEDILQAGQDLMDGTLGADGYDVGHTVIWKTIGGVAINGVCTNGSKSDGYSGNAVSVVTLWVDYVAHEIGHQFSADHNFVATECNTSVDGFRYEPGEGSSIMGYAGICGDQATYASASDPYFHYSSIAQIQSFIATVSCGTRESTGNSSAPVPNAQGDITIPKSTPFVLVGSATDANDAASQLTYGWQQYDGGSPAVEGSPDCSSTDAPLFRYRPPTANPLRSFPQYTDVIAGNNVQKWEQLPCAARTMNFSMAVRDNNTTFGRVADDKMKVTVANTGPFEVTAPNGGESLTGNTASTITWTVNGTDAHCSNVDILLSTDGSGIYTVIADATTNDGSESVMIPNSASTTARILIRCDVSGGFRSASTFYDISNANFTITGGTSGGCDMDLATTGFANPTPSGDYSASNTITSDKKLANASMVNFYAGTSITLKAGFEVPSGAQFLAKIQACSNIQTPETSMVNTFENRAAIDQPTVLNTLGPIDATKLNISIFPNPVQDQLMVVSEHIQPLTYNLFRIDGKVINQGILNATIEIDVSHLPHGMYFLELLDKVSGIRAVKKVVVANRF